MREGERKIWYQFLAFPGCCQSFVGWSSEVYGGWIRGTGWGWKSGQSTQTGMTQMRVMWNSMDKKKLKIKVDRSNWIDSVQL